MVKLLTVAAALVAVITPFVNAQTFSDCDPTKKTCPANPGLNSATYTVDFTKGVVPPEWKMTYQNVTFAGADGAKFTIKNYTDGPTMASNFYIFFGKVEAVMKAAPGAGIVSSFILESDDLDEVDWEMIGSQTTQAQSNYFGKGNTTDYTRGAYHPVTNPADSFHTYTIDWQQDSTTWSIDGKVVRTLNFADALDGKNYPQTPSNIRLGNWVAGQPGGSKGTIDWAGGIADLTKAPFDMFVKSISITNYNPAASYSYGDKTGSWQSIQKSQKVVEGSPSESGSNPKPSVVSESVRGSKSSVISESVRGGNVASVVTISPGPKGVATTALAVATNSANGKLNTVTINVGGGSNGTAPTAARSVVSINTGAAVLGSGTSTSRPAQVTTNAALKLGGSTGLVAGALAWLAFVL